MDEINQDPDFYTKTPLRSELENIERAIKQSWHRDIDATIQMQKLISIQNQILSQESFISYFASQSDFQYFINQFTEEILSNILRERPVPGENGDDFALILLTNYILFYTKFHNETTLLPLWTKMRTIFKTSSHYFLQGNGHQYGNLINNPKRNITVNEFNASMINNNKEFKINDRCDVYLCNMEQSNDISKHCFVRGTIVNMDEECYYVVTDICDREFTLRKESYDVFPEGEVTSDWEWRLNLKEYDIVDCFVNGRYRPATVLGVEGCEDNDEAKNVIKQYVIGYRILVDKCENYKSYVKYYEDGDCEKIDKQHMKYIGDNCEYDEVIEFYDLRIQKADTKIKEIKRNQLNTQTPSSRYMNQYFPYHNKNRNMFSGDNTEDEEDDILQYKYNYYCPYINKDNTKNYIIGKQRDFSYYYASLLQTFANHNGYEDIISIISTNTISSEDIYNVFFIIQSSLPYLHKNYLIENYNTITQSALKYIDNLSPSEMRNLKKELSDIITQVITRIQSKIGKHVIKEITKEKNSESNFPLIDEFTLKIGLKMINSSIFDKRLQGIKLLNDYLKTNKNDDSIVSAVLSLMKQNNIIQEIFGVNSHSQIITKSHDIIAIILEKHSLTNEDLNLILSGTQKGDLDGKLTIMNMLKDLSHYFSSEQRKNILKFIYEHIDISNIKEKEIEVIYFLSQSSDDENDVRNCISFFMECVMKCKVLNGDKTNSLFIEKLNEIAIKRKENLIFVFSECGKGLKSNVNAVMCYKILLWFVNKMGNMFMYGNEDILLLKETFDEYFQNENDLLKLYQDNFHLYKQQAKDAFNNNNNNEILIDGFNHNDNISIRLSFISTFTSRNDFNITQFLINILYSEPVSPNDHNDFFKFFETILTTNNTLTYIKDKHFPIISELFKLFSNPNLFIITSINDISLRVFCITFLYYNIHHEHLIPIDAASHSSVYDDNIDNTKHTSSILNDYTLNINPGDLYGFDILWNIILSSPIPSIITDALKLLQALYNKNNQSHLLLSKCTNAIKNASTDPVFNYKKYFNIINLIFLESESKGIPIIKSHSDLLKQNITSFKITVLSLRISTEPDIFKNTTISEMKILIAQQNDCEYSDISIEYNKDFVPNHFNCIPAASLFTDINEDVYIRIKDRKKADLLDIKTGQATPKYLAIINEWFDMFSEEQTRMTLENIRAFTEKVTTSNKRIEITDERVVGLLERYSSRDVGYITREHFIDFYTTAARDKPHIVWENLGMMGYRKDLVKKVVPAIVEVSKKEEYPRYLLGNDAEFINILFDMFNKVTDANVKNDIFEFIMNMSTNDKMYKDILEGVLKEEKVLFGNKNELVDLYKMHIVESIVEDVKYWGSNISGGYGNDDNKEVYDCKRKWMEGFYESGQFIKLISYVCDLVKKIGNANERNNIIVICFNYAMKLLFTFFYLIVREQHKQKETATSHEETKANDSASLPPPPSQNICAEEEWDINNSFNDININYDINDTILNEHLLHLMKELITIITYILEQNNIQSPEPNIHNIDIKLCFVLFISILIYKPNIFESIHSSPQQTQLTDLITKCLLSKHPHYRKFFNKKLLTYTQTAYNIHQHNILFYLYSICLHLFKDLLQSPDTSSKSQNTFSLFFDYFTSLYEKIYILRTTLEESILNAYISQFNIGSDEFIIDLYESILDYILTENSEERTLSGDIFIGVLKLIIKGIENNPDIKSLLLCKKRNNLSILPQLIKFVIPSEEQCPLIQDTPSSQSNEFIPLSTITNKTNNDHSILLQKKHLCKFISTLIEGHPSYSTEYFIHNSKFINEQLVLFEKEMSTHHEAVSNYSQMRGRSEGYVGLKNLGCICYMNSIMQQMYMVPSFRYAILQSDDRKEIDVKTFDDNLLHQLQRMYTYLLLSQKEYFNPKMFCLALKDMDGNATNVMVQQDSQEFLNAFCDKIENCLKDTEFKYIINDVFVGRTCSQVICDTCKHVSNRFEDFYNLTLEVKNINNLNESLEKMILPEKIGDFNCENCKNKVTITKRTTLSDLPNVLIVHLRRFWMNYDEFHTEKINSSFKFPTTINLKKFCLEDIMSEQSIYETDEIYYKEDDYYEYTLKGVTVHIGTAEGGHYFSFINVNREEHQHSTETWLKFNDSHISKFDVKDIPDECFGGTKEIEEGRSYENFQNAYLLIYERKLKKPIRYVYKTNQNWNDVIEYDENERNKIRKENDVSRKMEGNVNRNEMIKELEKKVFCDLQKKEFYVYKDFYSLERKVPLCYYKQVQSDNKQFLLNQNKDNSFYDLLKKIEDHFKQHIQEHPELILNESNEIKESLCEMTLKKLLMLLSTNENDEENILCILTDLRIYFSILTQLMKDNNVNISKFFSFLEKHSRFEMLATLDKKYILFIEQLFNFLETFLIDNINKESTKQYAQNIIKLVLGIFTPLNMIIHSKSNQILPPFYSLFYTVMKYIENDTYAHIQSNFNIIGFFIKGLINTYKKYESYKAKDCKVIVESLFAFIMRVNQYNDAQYIPNESKPFANNEHNIYINDINSLLNELENEMFLHALMHINLCYYKNILLFLYTYQRTSIPNEIIRILKEIEQNNNNPSYIKNLYNIIFEFIQIKDAKTLERFTFILGYPQLNFEFPNSPEQIWPVFGYTLYKRDNKSMYRYLTPNHIEQKYSMLQLLNNNFDYEATISLLKITKEHYGLFKYLYLMPSNAMKCNNCYEWMILQCEEAADNEEDQKKRDEMKSEINDIETCNTSKKEKIVKYVEEFIHKEKNNEDNIKSDMVEEEWELPGWKGYLTNMIPKYIVREKIKKISSGYDLVFSLFEYVTTVIEVDILKPSIKLLEELENDKNESKQSETQETENEPTSDKANESKQAPTPEGSFIYKSTIHVNISNQLTFSLEHRGYNERLFMKQLNSSKLANNRIVCFINPCMDQNTENTISIYRFTILNNSLKRGTISFTKQHPNKSTSFNFFVPNFIIDSLLQHDFRDSFIIHSFRKEQKQFASSDISWDINLNTEQPSKSNYSSYR